jgi:DNA invertase Pin-like site-specific DNA recombinase
MNSVIGYARISAIENDLSAQEAALRSAGCGVIRAEKHNGGTTEGREELRAILDFLRDGDVLVVTRIDRLAHSISDLQNTVRIVSERGASLKATEQPIDTSTAEGKSFLDMLDVFAEFETILRKERQLEGIAKAKAAGVYQGRPARSASTEVDQVRSLEAEGMAKPIEIGRASLYGATKPRTWKPRVWELAVDAVVALGGRATASEIRDYIVSMNPNYVKSNLGADLSMLSVNSVSRIHYSQNKNHPRRTDTGNEHDRLYKEGEGRDAVYVLYNPAVHGVWEITPDGAVAPKLPQPHHRIDGDDARAVRAHDHRVDLGFDD